MQFVELGIDYVLQCGIKLRICNKTSCRSYGINAIVVSCTLLLGLCLPFFVHFVGLIIYFG